MRQIEHLKATGKLHLHPRSREQGWRACSAPAPPRQPSVLPLNISRAELVATSLLKRGAPSCPIPRSSLKHKPPSPIVLVLAVVSLTGTMGNRFYNQPKLDVGTRAPQTIKAPANANIPDIKTTEEQRKAARIGAVAVLMRDRAVERSTYQDLQRLLGHGSELRQLAGEFPFLPTSVLSRNSQVYLRECPEWEWRAVLTQLEDELATPAKPSLETPPEAVANPQRRSQSVTPDDRQGVKENAQQQSIVELQTYRQTASKVSFSSLIETVSLARKHYADTLEALNQQSTSEQGQLYDSSLFNLSDAVWQKTQTGIYRAAQRMLAQGIPDGLPKEIIQEAAKLQVQDGVPIEAQPLAIKLLSGTLKSNLVKDPEGTRQLAELAAQKVKPVMVSVERGEAIVREGEVISQQAFVLLDHFSLSRREVNWLGLAGFVGLVSGAVGIVVLIERHHRLRRRDHILLLLLSLSAPLLVSLGLPSTSLPAIGILISSFYGSTLGTTVVGLLSVVLPVGLEIDAIHWLASVAGGVLAAVMAGRLRSREELALLGGAVGLTQGTVYLMMTMIASSTAGSIWYGLLGTVALQALAGVAWSIVALGLSPYLEHLFDLITPIRLAELANPNRPLLKRLASEAPGTFQHTLFVCSLAEAAARALGCNVELVRTGTLYHDIGKMHDPMAFVENQMGGPNKHDEINDPWLSAEIIKKHVSEGLVMARKHRLPKAIQAFIPEHQGTMLIAYFYHQAQQIGATDRSRVVQEKDFRYDGPVPQSRETGILMLADSCEAGLRSLKDATHEEALQMVNKILRARWQDHQLDDSGLTREEMSQIAEIFVRVWEQFNHKRIAYPKAVLSPR